ncbi:MAG: hypothetical protein HYX86_06320 [Chloroflexi bacterium]|nr:hypothetical protein [Chloroflexota bacterium]
MAERFISLKPPTPQEAGQRFLAFLREELAERDKEDVLLAVYATQEGSTITLWAFFRVNALNESEPVLEPVRDAEVKIKAGYFTPAFGQPSFSIVVKALPAQGRALEELEANYFAGDKTLVRIYP